MRQVMSTHVKRLTLTEAPTRHRGRVIVLSVLGGLVLISASTKPGAIQSSGRRSSSTR